MSSEKLEPYRHVEYVKVCGRCEQLLQVEEQRSAARKKFWQRARSLMWLSVFVCVPVGVVATLTWKLDALAPDPPPETKSRFCYFVRQTQDPDPDPVPYWPWFVYKADLRWPRHNVLAGRGREFPTKDEAWAFIVKWKLEPCR